VNGATSYDIYIGDEINGFTLLTSIVANSGNTYTAEGLTNDMVYTFYAVARRVYNGVNYDSQSSDMLVVTLKVAENTSTEGKIFATEADLLSSWAYQKIAFFKKYADYSKSYAIPGLITTNVGGFSSTRMCPQGLAFAEDYLLMTAYDIASEENSVIYVMDKTTKELLITLILPSKPHVGGITYDGVNVWITNGSRVSSISFSEIDAAAQIREPYYYINYKSTCVLGIVTSYVTYYDNKLWVGSYNELQSTYMYSYVISDKDIAPALTKAETIDMPTRVQGVAFTSKGTMILSRSCQLYKGLRGYMRQLDTYKPAFSIAVDGIIPIGNLINSVSMPSMNEGIAIDGDYLYVTFESGAFDASSYKMDRICAFNLTAVVRSKLK
jgi:hypothetical protein